MAPALGRNRDRIGLSARNAHTTGAEQRVRCRRRTNQHLPACHRPSSTVPLLRLRNVCRCADRKIASNTSTSLPIAAWCLSHAAPCRSTGSTPLPLPAAVHRCRSVFYCRVGGGRTPHSLFTTR